MSRIVLSTMGSLGDLHPMIALGLELSRRGHDVVVNSWSGYKEKVDALGLEFANLRPDVDPDDEALHRKAMHPVKGPEFVVKELILPNISAMYDDLMSAIEDADLFLSGEIVYAAPSAAATSGVKWISTSLAPLSMFSSHDPNIYPQASWVFDMLRPLPVGFHKMLFGIMRWTIKDWFAPYREFRSRLGLDPDHDPVFTQKYSSLLHLAMFSRVLGEPQPDWFQPTVQTGFCFYDESEGSQLDTRLERFLSGGEPPIVFTLGSAAVMDADARRFFDESIKAARKLDRRAVLLYGRDQPVPDGLDKNIVGFEFAPYSLVFPHAACVVHQAGVGTTGQVLRAGVPHVIMPFSHDQPDNAARCRRAGVAQVIPRGRYTAERAAKMINAVLNDKIYRQNASRIKQSVDAERGTTAACDAIEEVLR